MSPNGTTGDYLGDLLVLVCECVSDCLSTLPHRLSAIRTINIANNQSGLLLKMQIPSHRDEFAILWLVAHFVGSVTHTMPTPQYTFLPLYTLHQTDLALHMRHNHNACSSTPILFPSTSSRNGQTLLLFFRWLIQSFSCSIPFSNMANWQLALKRYRCGVGGFHFHSLNASHPKSEPQG